jgi:hypothetical protein
MFVASLYIFNFFGDALTSDDITFRVMSTDLSFIVDCPIIRKTIQFYTFCINTNNTINRNPHNWGYYTCQQVLQILVPIHSNNHSLDLLQSNFDNKGLYKCIV